MPQILTYIFKSHSLPNMWQVLTEFSSVSSEGKKKKKKKIELQ